MKTSHLVHQERMDGLGKYLAPLLNLPPRGAYSDAKQVVQQLNLLNARGANMVIYCMWVWMGVAAARDTSDERPPLFYDQF